MEKIVEFIGMGWSIFALVLLFVIGVCSAFINKRDVAEDDKDKKTA